MAVTNSWDLIVHQAGTSVLAAGSSASTATTWPIGTSPIRSASMMIGIGHFLPSASIVKAGADAGAPAGGVGGVTRSSPRLDPRWLAPGFARGAPSGRDGPAGQPGYFRKLSLSGITVAIPGRR